MRIVFMGTAELACPCLEAVAGMSEHQVVAVITQPDRPKGRNLKLAPPPVKLTAQRLSLTVQQPEKIRDPAVVESLRVAGPELVIVVAYGQILPTAVLAVPSLGCVNVHASLLPRWRGAAPIQYAILHGDRETGVTTLFMDEHMDTGDILLQRAEPVRPDDTSAALHDRLARLGAALLVETVKRLAAGTAPRSKQDESRATYAKKINKEDGRIDWRQPAAAIERQVRAFDPWPGAQALWGETPIKIWRAEVVESATERPGELLARGLVGTGRAGLRLLEVQPAGGRRMSFAEFGRGHPLPAGTLLG